MRSYEAGSEISATADEVWAVLSDVDGWAGWDSGIVSVDGRLAAGEKVKIVSNAAPGRAFAVKVTELRPAEHVELRGGMPLGLFRGVRTYDLQPAAGAGTRFRMREVYTGPMLPLIWRSMPDLQPSFDHFARGLKQRVESNGR
jgi:hypothetical protein